MFKDDGFGPMVIHALEDYFKENDIEKPEDTQFIDAGTGATHFIFSMPDDNWKKVIVVDVVEWNAEPGTLKIFSPYDMPKGKYENAHTWPVEEPLHDLVDMGIEVVIVKCHADGQPLNDEHRKIFAFPTPLFLRVVLHQLFIHIRTALVHFILRTAPKIWV